MNLAHLINHTVGGGATLFCGAGFSASGLSWQDQDVLGTSGALLELLNSEIAPHMGARYRQITNAADKYKEIHGEWELLNLLKGKYNASHVTDEMTDILSFKWDRIYTTNYDNSIRKCCESLGKKCNIISNDEPTKSVDKRVLDVIHLHGCAEKWNISNFSKSCILGAESYFDAERTIGQWIHTLQTDFDRSELFVFIGFSANDFHLSKAFFNAKYTKDKVFFINKSSATNDVDLIASQEKFGTPLSIGASGLRDLLRQAINAGAPSEPIVPSYRRYVRPIPAVGVPTVEAIRDLFVFGEIDEAQIVRDVDIGKSDYHILRSRTDEFVEFLTKESNVMFISGEICDGKSILVLDVAARLSVSRQVFMLKNGFTTVVQETRDIIGFYSNPLIIIENCFELTIQHINEIILIFKDSPALLVLTGRSVSSKIEIRDYSPFDELDNVKSVRMPRLDDAEISVIVNMTDQVAGWISFQGTDTDKSIFIKRKLGSSLPAVLMEIHKSEYVRNKYLEEYRKVVDFCNKNETMAIVAAIYISHLGFDAPLSLLSNIFRIDFGAVVDRLNSNLRSIRIVRIKNDRIVTVPSIGARNILREIVPEYDPNVVVGAIVRIMEYISFTKSMNDFERRMSDQLMRYSTLSVVVRNDSEINRFFDNLSKIEYCRSRVLFWLQWHMAMLDQSRFIDADTYLKRSFAAADARDKKNADKYDRVQLNDRKAKFLMIWNQNKPFNQNMFYDVKTSCDLTLANLRRAKVTHHPYETVQHIVDFYEGAGREMHVDLRQKCANWLREIKAEATRRLSALDDGFPKATGNAALSRLAAF